MLLLLLFDGIINRRDSRVANAVCAPRADMHSHVDAVSSGRSRFRFPRPAGHFEEGFYGLLSSRRVNAFQSRYQAI